MNQVFKKYGLENFNACFDRVHEYTRAAALAAIKKMPRGEYRAELTLPDNGFGVAERRMDSPSHGIGVAPGGKTLWVTSISANAVFAYSLPELKLLGHAALPALKLPGRAPISAVPNWVTFTPDGKLLYITNAAARSVSVIDTGAMKLVATVPVGEVPKRLNTLVLR